MAKENKKRKGNLKYSILLLLLIAILLITSTYAWFTANQVVSVGTLDVQVQAANGLQISVDAIHGKHLYQNKKYLMQVIQVLKTKYQMN